MRYFIFILLINLLSLCYLNFSFLKFLLRLSFEELETKKCSEALREELARKIHRRFKKISEAYILECFERYPNVLISYRNNKIKGCYFFTKFEENEKFYYYLGPTFFLDKLSLSCSYFNCFIQEIKQREQAFFMAELQNPELIMHIHYAFPDCVFPQAKTFYISDRARKALVKFSENINQLDELNISQFKSKGQSSLYYKSTKEHLVTTWLENNNVYLNKNESLIIIFDLDSQALRRFKKRFIYALLSYPSHKNRYMKDLEEFLSHV